MKKIFIHRCRLRVPHMGWDGCACGNICLEDLLERHGRKLRITLGILLLLTGWWIILYK